MRRRSLFAVLALFASSPAVHAASKSDDLAELQNYRLTLPVLKKLGQVQENIYDSIKKDPSVATKYQSDRDHGSDQSLEGAVKKMDAVPELKHAIDKAGLTTREYFLATMAMVQAGMAQMMLKGAGADASKLPSGVRANMKFMEQNQAAFAQIQNRSREIERETKKLTARKASKDEEAGEEPPSDESADKQ
jgi:hypothetical protein